MGDTKKIVVVLDVSKNNIREPEPKIPKKRIITRTDTFINSYSSVHVDSIQYIKQIYENNVVDTEKCNLIQQQIRNKLHGYRGQDIDKKLFDDKVFVKLEQVLKLMIDCENKCYYCKESVHVLYENVREPKQWTLDRINNKMGHNHGNLLIACLNCNLRRRTMHTERYVFTKQLNIVKHE
jgi:hypothetical protein